MRPSQGSRDTSTELTRPGPPRQPTLPPLLRYSSARRRRRRRRRVAGGAGIALSPAPTRSTWGLPGAWVCFLLLGGVFARSRRPFPPAAGPSGPERPAARRRRPRRPPLPAEPPPSAGAPEAVGRPRRRLGGAGIGAGPALRRRRPLRSAGRGTDSPVAGPGARRGLRLRDSGPGTSSAASECSRSRSSCQALPPLTTRAGTPSSHDPRPAGRPPGTGGLEDCPSSSREGVPSSGAPARQRATDRYPPSVNGQRKTSCKEFKKKKRTRAFLPKQY